jgi:hypothetical protein
VSQRRVYALGVCLLVLWGWALPALAQQPFQCTPQTSRVNRANNKTDITVGATPVQVIVADAARCSVFLRNKGAAAMRCLPVVEGAPTASVGYEFAPGDQVLMTTEGREAWHCVRTTGTSTTVTTMDHMP